MFLISPGQDLFYKLHPILIYVTIIICLVVIIQSLFQKRISKIVGAVICCGIGLYFVYSPIKLIEFADIIVKSSYSIMNEALNGESPANTKDLLDFNPTDFK